MLRHPDHPDRLRTPPQYTRQRPAALGSGHEALAGLLGRLELAVVRVQAAAGPDLYSDASFLLRGVPCTFAASPTFSAATGTRTALALMATLGEPLAVRGGSLGRGLRGCSHLHVVASFPNVSMRACAQRAASTATRGNFGETAHSP